MSVILLHGNYRHVSAIHVAIFRVMRTRIKGKNKGKAIPLQAQKVPGEG
jgi:hypothetical protein